MSQSKNYAFPTGGQTGYIPDFGLTKREYFAGVALQALIQRENQYNETAREAVWYADALLAELDRKSTYINPDASGTGSSL